MTKLKELSKLNIGKLKANEMFDEFLKFKDNWVEVLTGEGHIELDTKNYRLIKNGKFTLLIEETELCYSLFKFGLMNLLSLIDFLTIYAK